MHELRPLAPVDYEIMIYQCDEYVSFVLPSFSCCSSNNCYRVFCSPITEAYHSAFSFASHPHFSEYAVTKAEYMEGGSNACRRKFKNQRPVDEPSKDDATAKVKGKGRQKDDSNRPELAKPSGRSSRLRTISTGTRRR